MNAKNRIVPLFAVYMVMITVLTFVYDYPETLLKRPQSVHNWRQCDGASIALNYYQDGMHFFKPQTHLLYSDGNTTGYAAPSEIPVLYYFVAVLYKVFGFHEYLFRGVCLLIFYIGLFYLFRLADMILKDVLYASVATLLLFSSPVLVYYANNFVPNTVALSFSFIGWYYFYKYYLDKRSADFLRMVLFFGIAASMKITGLTGPIIVLTLLFAERLKIIHTGLDVKHRFALKVVSVLAIFAVITGWVLYARHFNSLHNSVQFMTHAGPIWETDIAFIRQTFHTMKGLWFGDYFYPATFWFMIACLLTLVVFWKRSGKIFRWICLGEVIAMVAYMILWFQALRDHDYFLIGFYTVPALLFINFFYVLQSFGIKKVNVTIVRLIFMGVVLINVFYAGKRHTLRYEQTWMNDYLSRKDLYTIGPWLRESGIREEDTVVFYPSEYIRPLYLMNLKGWNLIEHPAIDPVIEDRVRNQMNQFISNGAEYFITSDIKSAVRYASLKPFMTDLFSKYNSIFIFRLPPRDHNFNPADSSMLLNY